MLLQRHREVADDQALADGHPRHRPEGGEHPAAGLLGEAVPVRREPLLAEPVEHDLRARGAGPLAERGKQRAALRVRLALCGRGQLREAPAAGARLFGVRPESAVLLVDAARDRHAASGARITLNRNLRFPLPCPRTFPGRGGFLCRARSYRAPRAESGTRRSRVIPRRMASLPAMSRLRPTRAACHMHPKATHLVDRDGDHGADLDVSGESLPNYLFWVASSAAYTSATASSRWAPGLGASRRATSRVGRWSPPTCLRPACGRCASASPSERAGRRSLPACPGAGRAFNSVLMVNVLEHIADDAGALRGLT